MKKNKKFISQQKDKGKRLDIFLMEQIGKNRSETQKFIRNNFILVNGKIPAKTGYALKIGDQIELIIEKDKKKEACDSVLERAAFVEASADKYDEIKIIVEADDYLVIEKPAGLMVHPTKANEKNTLADWVLKRYPKIKKVGDNENRPGIVHRLDKDVSGLMVIAKTQAMFLHLKKQFQDRTVEKEYIALAHGRPELKYGILDFEIDRGAGGRMAARPKINRNKLKNVGKEQTGKQALTEFWVEKYYARFSLLKIRIHTGRTHQIRVHMLAYNHPLVGDDLYFNKKLNRKRDIELGRLFLHSRRLCFNNLIGERMCFESKLPEKLRKFLEKIN